MASAFKFVPTPTAKLSSGYSIPLVGLGTWKSEPGVVGAAVSSALEAGYRHIDAAAIYGNEHEVGEALSAAISGGKVKREDLFVTSKLWNSKHRAADVRPALEKTLKDLRLDYLDLYLIHWPITGVPGPELTPPVVETWAALEALVDAGLVRSIGVSNFSVKKLGRLLDVARIPPSVLQVEIHPYWRNDALLNFAESKGIHVTAYSPLGSPDSSHLFKRKKSLDPLRDEVVGEVAAKLGRNAGQVLIRWALQHGTSVIPKSVSPARIAGNLDVLSWAIPADDFVRIETLPEQQRNVHGAVFLNPKGPYVTLEDLWDEPEDGVTVPPRANIEVPLIPAHPTASGL